MQAIIKTLVDWRKNPEAVHASVASVLKSGSIHKNEKNFRVEVVREAFYASTKTSKDVKIPQSHFEMTRAMLPQKTINLFY